MNLRDLINLQPTIQNQVQSSTAGRRYEFKISADWGSAALGRSWLRLHPEGFKSTYPSRLVNNLYLDTFALQSFQENRWGIGDRVKVRLRWYGQLQDNVVINPFLELKIKNNLLGDKFRQPLSCTLDLNRSYQEIFKLVLSAAGAQWRAKLNFFNQPTLLNRYKREYFASPDGEIRATLDYDVTSYNQRFSAFPNLKRRTSHDNRLLIEVKASPQNFERLQEVMGHFPIQRGRNSKYVNGVSGGPF